MLRNLIKFLAGMATALVAIILIYQVPFVHAHLWWRVEVAKTYLTAALNPAGNLPTPRVATSDPTEDATVSPTATVTPAPTKDPNEGTPTPLPSPTVTPTLAPLPPTVSLTAPKYEQQEANACGPTTLSMYLRFYGWDGTQRTIDEVVKPSPDDRNVNIDELEYFVNTQVSGLSFQYRVGGTLDRLKRVLAAGMPIAVEKGMHLDETYWPDDDHWAGHYLLLTGYDESKASFISQDSFYGANKLISYTELDGYWKAFNRVYFIIYPPDQEETLRTILGDDWDPDINRQHALDAAQAEADADTQSGSKDGYAWFNVGTNLVYFQKYAEAARAYDQAREAGLPQRMLRYQFGPFIAYFHSGRVEDLLDLTEYALKRTANSEEAMLWYGWALYRQGKRDEADQWFHKALTTNPTYQDAQYAVNFMQGQ